MNASDSIYALYHVYLLRLRYMENGGDPRWVYSLESPDGVERHEFGTLQALTDFLTLRTPPQSRCAGHSRLEESAPRAMHAESRR